MTCNNNANFQYFLRVSPKATNKVQPKMTGALSFPTHILTFLEWLKKTDGRDKLYRLVAYGSKVPIHILKENGGDKDLIQKLSKGASAVGLSRKLMRMFRSLQFMQDFLQAFGVADQFEKGLSMIKAFALTIWMLVDHAQWFDKVGYIKLSDTKKLADIHSKVWFVGLLIGAIQSGLSLPSWLLGYKLKKLYGSGVSKDVKDFKKKEEKLFLGIIKNGTDLIVGQSFHS
jgi:hypothetical protein